jgi:TM2 domain-containing membrane protein YozV
MILPDDKNTGGRFTPAAKSISVHRAFVYGASAPGLGEFYAGSRLRGLVTAALFLFTTVWFARALFIIFSRIMDRIFDSLNGAAPFVMPDVPYISAAISFFAIYFIWLWAMIAAIDSATAHRRSSGEPPQASIAWAVAAAWFCPGAGHVYAGTKRYGYLLFAAYLLAILAVVPAYQQLFDGISQLAGSGELTPNDQNGSRIGGQNRIQLWQTPRGVRQVFCHRRHDSTVTAAPSRNGYALVTAFGRIRCSPARNRMAVSGSRTTSPKT